MLSQKTTKANSEKSTNKPNNIKFGIKGLLLKFFLVIWSVIFIGAFSVGIWTYIYEILPSNEDYKKLEIGLLKIHSKAMVKLYESGNAKMLPYMFPPGSTEFYDNKGTPLINSMRNLPAQKLFNHNFINEQNSYKWNSPKLKAFIGNSLTSTSPIILETDGSIFIGCSVLGETGKNYVAIRLIHSRLFKRQHQFKKKLLNVLPIFLIGSAIICLLLSRFVVKPILEIQQSGQQFIDGNLTARVEKEHVNRRDELGHLSQTFNKMADKIEVMVLSQQKLQSDISHELRSPLARIQIAVELTKKQLKNQDSKYLDKISLDISRMDNLVGQILELSKVNKTLSTLEKKEIAITDRIQDIVKDANFEANTTNKKISFSYKEKLKILGINELLSRAFENVIRNALKYTADNTEVHIEQTLNLENKMASFVITDKGPGVKKEELSQIFEPFFRCQAARDRKTGGVGLGLAIAKRAIDRHSGNIYATNCKSGGLIVTIELSII